MAVDNAKKVAFLESLLKELAPKPSHAVCSLEKLRLLAFVEVENLPSVYVSRVTKVDTAYGLTLILRALKADYELGMF